MNKSVGIILERKDDGSYSINGVDVEGNNKTIWDNCIRVPLDEYNFSCLRDGDNTRFKGKGVLTAVNNVNNILKNEIVGMDASNQEERRLIESITNEGSPSL